MSQAPIEGSLMELAAIDFTLELLEPELELSPSPPPPSLWKKTK